MSYVWGALAGCAWGVVIGSVKYFLLATRLLRSEKISSANSLSVYFGLSILVNIVALLLVFFLRKLLPFSIEATLIGTALALTLTSRLYPITKIIALNERNQNPPTNEG